MSCSYAELPDGVSLVPLKMNRDGRGVFTEVFRETWNPSFKPLQWNFVQSAANVLRGVHVHVSHTDYLILARGSAVFALKDLRTNSPTFGRVTMLEVHEDNLQAVIIPPGVAHGFYFYAESCHLYSVSHYWSHDDELGCLWSDPALGIPWPHKQPLVSERDAMLPSYKQLLSVLNARKNAENLL